MSDLHKKRPALATFGPDEAGQSITDGGMVERVDIKVYIPVALRDRLDRIAITRYGRGRMRSLVIEEALRAYVEGMEQR